MGDDLESEIVGDPSAALTPPPGTTLNSGFPQSNLETKLDALMRRARSGLRSQSSQDHGENHIAWIFVISWSWCRCRRPSL